MKRFKRGKGPVRKSEREAIPRRFRLRFLLQEIDLPVGEITIGRSPSCTVTFEDPLVSRHHGRIAVSILNAEYEDLGSRNGTVINGTDVYGKYTLNDQDRIRIGTQELVFLDVTNRPVTRGRTTGYLRICPECRMVFPEGSTRCPHCGTEFNSERKCANCGHSAGVMDNVCSVCGYPIAPEDSTIPAEMGGRTSGWEFQLVSEVFQKAFAAGRYERAGKILEDMMRDFDERDRGQDEKDRHSLRRISRCGFEMAQKTGDIKWLRWGIDRHRNLEIILHTSLVDLIEPFDSSGSMEFRGMIKKYLDTMEETLNPETVRNDDRIRRLKAMLEKENT